MCVPQSVVINFELKHSIHIWQLKLDTVFTTCSEKACVAFHCMFISIFTSFLFFYDLESRPNLVNTVFLEVGPYKGVDPDKLQLNVVSVKWHPAALGQHLDYNAVFL